MSGRSHDHQRRLPRAPRTRRREGRGHRDRVGAVLDARADGPQSAGVDGPLAERREQRIPQRFDLPAPELSDSGEPGAVVWERQGACDGLEGRAAAQHARLEAQLLGDAVARRLETLDARLYARVARGPGGAVPAPHVCLAHCPPPSTGGPVYRNSSGPVNASAAQGRRPSAARRSRSASLRAGKCSVSAAAYASMAGGNGRRDQSAFWCSFASFTPTYFSSNASSPTAGSPASWAAMRVSNSRRARKP